MDGRGRVAGYGGVMGREGWGKGQIVGEGMGIQGPKAVSVMRFCFLGQF